MIRKNCVFKMLVKFLMITLFISSVLCNFKKSKFEIKGQDDWCVSLQPYFQDNCPIKRGDYNGCCLCTQVIYFSIIKLNS